MKIEHLKMIVLFWVKLSNDHIEKLRGCFLKDNDAFLAMDKLMMTLKMKPELISVVSRLTNNIIKIVFYKKNAENQSDW